MLDLSNCLDLTDKDNIQIEESDDGEIHITAQLWLWGESYFNYNNIMTAPDGTRFYVY